MKKLVVSSLLAKSQVAAFTRKDGVMVQAHDSGKMAAAPPLSTHHEDLRSSSKDGDLDHWHNQVAADHMKNGDHKALAGTLKNMDTAARDHVLEHIHPDHYSGLGFEPTDKARSLKEYGAKFPDKKAAAPVAGGAGSKFNGEENGPSAGALKKFSKKDPTAKAILHSQEATNIPHSSANRGKWDSLPDDENPKHAMSGLSSKALGRIASGKVNATHHAMHELSNRGQDMDGKHIGAGKFSEFDGKDQEVAEHFQTVHGKVLSAAAKGHLDLRGEARQTLSGRGHDAGGNWVGFAEAKKHHGIK